MSKLHKYRTQLESLGAARVDGLIPKSEAIIARDLIYEIASNHGLYTSGGWRRSDGRFVLDKSFRTALKALNASARFPNLISENLVKFTEELLGEQITPLPPGQQILFTLPGATSWSVPHDVWHIDVPRLGELGPPGLQVFIYLDELAPEGGGTLAVAGSHRLLNSSNFIRSKDLKPLLQKETYFQNLFDAERGKISCLEDTMGTLGDVDLEVVELTGQIGDVYFMDLRTLHTPAPNASETARIMLTCRLPRTAIVSKLMPPKSQ